jgi:gluconolactonase
MKLHLLLAAAVAAVVASPAFADDLTPRPTLGEIVKSDPALDALIAPDAKIEVLASGLNWSEGPVWSRELGAVLFSDVPENHILKWKEGEGMSVYLKPSGFTGILPYSREPGSNGLTMNAKGELCACEHGDRRVSVLTKGGGKRTLADNFEGKRFNSPNDLCFDKAGNLYFTDPPYGLPKGPADKENRQLEWNGVYRLSAEGKLTLLTKEMTFPNGIALSPDEKTLYVAQPDSKAALWKAFPLKDDGTAGESKVLADASAMAQGGQYRGGCDGMKVDQQGHIWATGPGGVHIMTPEGKLLGRIECHMACGNCCFGDDGSTLYICADAFLVRVKTKVKGCGF